VALSLKWPLWLSCSKKTLATKMKECVNK
jgi:hypothetical protein